MAKTVPAALQTHLNQDVTAIAAAWQITRLDGTIFRFTTGSRDATLDFGAGNFSFSASEGFSRTNISNDADLNVGNMEVVGIFDNAQITETDLRRGLFDFADVKIGFYNMDSPSDGIIKMLRGQLAEVIVTPKGWFNVELRDLTQVFSKTLGEYYSKDCRDDLGGTRCAVPIFPDFLPGNTAVAEGDFYRIPTTPDNDSCAQIVLNMEGPDGSTTFTMEGTYTTAPTVNGNAQVDTAQTPAGGDSTSSLLLDGTGDYLSWADNAVFELSSNPFTIHCHFRLNATGITQCIASQYQATTTQRSWYLRINASNQLEFSVWQTGSTLDVTLTGTTTLTTGVDYHGAIVRKTNGDYVLFLDGGIEAGPTTPTTDPFNSTADLRIGALESGGVSQFFNGWIDSFQFLNGFATWEAAFTPPTGNIDVGAASYIWEDFGDRIYEVTTEGTTAACPSIPDTVVGNTHSQGSAVLTARHSFMRFAQVSAVDGSEPRRKFTVTELTPNTGYAITDRTPSALGFADDFFNFGQVFFETGNNIGRGKEVRDFVADDGITITQDIELFEPLPFDIVVGDKLKIYPGCDKTHALCISRFNNALNFVGEPFVPGQDILGQYPDARAR